MTVWCDNCGLEKNPEDCPGYNKHPKKECCHYIPTRLNGTPNFNLEE